MLKTTYYDYIYKVDGETIKLKPEKIFDPSGVYLIVDKEIKLIWIWAGSHSRLFHRYMAANWAGKLKTKKKFYNFKYEVIKQGFEPSEFRFIYREIKENRTDLNYPGQSRNSSIKSEPLVDFESRILTSQTKTMNLVQDSILISKSDKSRIKKILLEIKEMQSHIKYSIEHIQKRFTEIEKILEK
ncbi:MAG: hypothetical protein ACFE8B_13610 [Candidatus Hermodarchaeota archaeon]